LLVELPTATIDECVASSNETINDWQTKDVRTVKKHGPSTAYTDPIRNIVLLNKFTLQDTKNAFMG